MDTDLSILLRHSRARTERIIVSCSWFFSCKNGFVFPFEHASDLSRGRFLRGGNRLHCHRTVPSRRC